MKGKLNSTWNGHDQQKKKEELWTASPEPALARSLSPTASVFRDRISPNMLKYSPRLSTTTTLRTRSALSRKSPHRKEDEELKYYQFVQEVTKDIIDRGVYSDRVLKNIIAHHMERRRNDLNMTRMRQLLMKLMDDLGVSQEGLFSTHAEKASHPENVHFNPELFVHEEE
uniref:Uncharacterized protein n=1 Tax=Plectus sambesii TaxID=2011161 RepID=A0A914V4S7_9BILA